MEDNIQNPQDLEQNPIGNELNVEVSIPKKIEIKMVDASSLNDYEIWVFISSLLCNFLVGFVVSTFSANSATKDLHIAVDIIFSVLLIGSLIMVFIKRKKMSVEKTTIPLSVKKSKR